MSNKDKKLIQEIIDNLLYLKDKEASLFRQELKTAVEHYHHNKKIEYNLSKFKFNLEEHI